MAGVTFAQLPDEEPAFFTYLQSTGDVWARAVRDDPHHPKHEPLPFVDFLSRFATEIVEYDRVDVYLGFQNDVLHPVVTMQESTEGGTLMPVVQDGKVVEAHSIVVGGTKVLRAYVDNRGSLIRYNGGRFRTADHLAMSNLGCHSGTYRGQTWVPNPPSFMKWSKKVFAWMRRRTPDEVQVYRCNYKARATMAVAEAHRQGLKVF